MDYMRELLVYCILKLRDDKIGQAANMLENAKPTSLTGNLKFVESVFAYDSKYSIEISLERKISPNRVLRKTIKYMLSDQH